MIGHYTKPLILYYFSCLTPFLTPFFLASITVLFMFCCLCMRENPPESIEQKITRYHISLERYNTLRNAGFTDKDITFFQEQGFDLNDRTIETLKKHTTQKRIIKPAKTSPTKYSHTIEYES